MTCQHFSAHLKLLKPLDFGGKTYFQTTICRLTHVDHHIFESDPLVSHVVVVTVAPLLEVYLWILQMGNQSCPKNIEHPVLCGDLVNPEEYRSMFHDYISISFKSLSIIIDW